MKFGIHSVMVVFLLWIGSIQAGERIVIGGLDGLDPEITEERYPILLAISGGGARGLSVIGVLKAFEEKGIQVRAIAGTSMGGIVGGLYACGYTPSELDSIANEIDFNTLFSNAPPRRSMFLTRRQENARHLVSIRFDRFRPIIPHALSTAQSLTSILTNLTTKATYRSGADFGNLPIPFRAVSTDIVSGEQVVLDSGSIADAMRATMAFPLAFTGVETEDRILMDGGMVNPLPVDVVKEMGDSSDFVVAVNTASKLVSKTELVTPVDIANQATSIMTASKLESRLAMADYVVTPDIGEFSSTDFKRMTHLINLGYVAAISAADSIISMIIERRGTRQYVIEHIECDCIDVGDRKRVDEWAEENITGRLLNRADLVREFKKLMQFGNWFRMEVVLDSASHKAVINVQEDLPVSATMFRFVGNAIFDDSTLASVLVESNEELSLRAFRLGLDRIRQLYQQQGHDLAEIDRVMVDRDSNLVTVIIDEAIVRRIDVKDNRRTRDWYVRAHFPIQFGKPYSTRLADQGIDNIYGTDLFNRVTVDVKPSGDSAVVDIRVDEKYNQQMRMGWHFHDEYESEEFAEFLDDNVGGIGLEYLLHGRYSPRRQEYYFDVSADRIHSTYLTGNVRIYRSFLSRQLYVNDDTEFGRREEKKTGGEITLGQQIARLGTVTTAFTLEKARYHYPDGNFSDERFDIRMISFESLMENLDQIPFPSSGYKLLLRIQLAGKYLGGDVEYSKFFGSAESYIPMCHFLNYRPRAAIGISRSGLPPSEQFYLGGLDSFFGFRTHQLAGDKMFMFSNQVRLKLPARLYLTVRHDIGEVYHGTDQIKLRNLRHGVGCVLSLDSPIGSIDVGYGVANRDIDRIYVNVGLEF